MGGGGAVHACSLFVIEMPSDVGLAAQVANGDLVVVGRVSDETVVPETVSTPFYDSTVDVHAVLAGSVDESTLHFTDVGWYNPLLCWGRPRLPEGARVLLVLRPHPRDGVGLHGDGPAFGNSEAGVLSTAYFFDDGDAFFIRWFGNGEPLPAGRAVALIGVVAAAAQSDGGEVARALLTALGEDGDEGVALLTALGADGQGRGNLQIGHAAYEIRIDPWPVLGLGLGLLAFAGAVLMAWRRESRSTGGARRER